MQNLLTAVLPSTAPDHQKGKTERKDQDFKTEMKRAYELHDQRRRPGDVSLGSSQGVADLLPLAKRPFVETSAQKTKKLEVIVIETSQMFIEDQEVAAAAQKRKNFDLPVTGILAQEGNDNIEAASSKIEQMVQRSVGLMVHDELVDPLYFLKSAQLLCFSPTEERGPYRAKEIFLPDTLHGLNDIGRRGSLDNEHRLHVEIRLNEFADLLLWGTMRHPEFLPAVYKGFPAGRRRVPN